MADVEPYDADATDGGTMILGAAHQARALPSVGGILESVTAVRKVGTTSRLTTLNLSGLDDRFLWRSPYGGK
jgi:hypothetical protein